MDNNTELPLIVMGHLQTNIVFDIGPVDADEGDEFMLCCTFHDHLTSARVELRTCVLELYEGDIVSRSDGEP